MTDFRGAMMRARTALMLALDQAPADRPHLEVALRTSVDELNAALNAPGMPGPGYVRSLVDEHLAAHARASQQQANSVPPGIVAGASAR